MLLQIKYIPNYTNLKLYYAPKKCTVSRPIIYGLLAI